MKFFFPHGIGNRVYEQVDWESETSQGELVCAHNLLDPAPYDGVLVSRAEMTTRVTEEVKAAGGMHAFLGAPSTLPIMGDCGAYTYRNEDNPVYTVEDTVEFYVSSGFDIGAALDHIVQDYWPHDGFPGTTPQECIRRQDLTLDLAAEFWVKSKGQGFVPMGVAQGWSPSSVAVAVSKLQAIGYTYIALGGLVALPSQEILRILRAVDRVREPSTRIHLFGVGRLAYQKDYESLGVVSTDTTSPFLDAFLYGPSYYTHDRPWMGLRVPRADSSRDLKRLNQRDGVSWASILEAEQKALHALFNYDEDPKANPNRVLTAVMDYLGLAARGRKQGACDLRQEQDTYLETLKARPWEDCPCPLCQDAGIRIMFLRGFGTANEYNWRRGYHNTRIFHQWVQEGRGKFGGADIADLDLTGFDRMMDDE